ncbi:HEAT repeat domain-containing protein [Halosimplex sp. J119]
MAEQPDVIRKRADVDPEAIARSLDAYPQEADAVGEALRSLDAERRHAAAATVADRLTAGDVAIRRAAALALSVCFETHPESDAAPELARALEDSDHVVRKHAGTALRAIAHQDPRDAVVAVQFLPALFDPESPDLLHAGLDIASDVAEVDPDAAAPLLDPLLDTLRGLADQDARPSEIPATGAAPPPAVREYQQQSATQLDRHRAQAVAVVERLLASRPDALAAVDASLSDLLRRETLGATRATLAKTLGQVAESEPETVASAIDDLASLLADEDPVVAASAAWALGMIADPHGRRVADAVQSDTDALAALLTVDPHGARIASATLLAYVAEHRPDALDPATDPLVAALDDEHPDVRASAALALGHAGRTDALAALRDATDDPDEQVRATARQALDRIESRS